MGQEKIKELEKLISSDYGNITGLVIQKNGVKLYENYFNQFTPGDAVHVFSVTKSVVSVLIGIAVDKGYIKSLDQKVLDFFPDYRVPPGETTIQSVTIKNLLTMTAPYKYETEPFEEFFTSANWVNFALDLLGGREPSGEFLYTAIIGAHILTGLLVKAAGQPVLDFAEENLFSPLRIGGVRNIVFRDAEEQLAWYGKTKHTAGWAADPQGINTASWGLTLTPADMAKIGQLYLDGGVWEGRRILSAEWIKESTKEHSRWKQQDLAYGYLWWIIDEQEPSYAAMGDGGNVIYVNGKNQMVISITSLFAPDVKDRIELIKTCIEPAFEN